MTIRIASHVAKYYAVAMGLRPGANIHGSKFLGWNIEVVDIEEG